MLNKENIEVKGLYIGENLISNKTILLEKLEANRIIDTLKVGTLGVGRAIHRNINNNSNQLP
ncbi:TPA: hypothetical protein I9071_002640 [Clostridium perfringens]|nr:hypothetical protein [Clostridium perfringens]HAT4321480.1 hypothetical protein [Clostridium perfringens]